MKKPDPKKPPEIGPYALPVVLAGMGFWCLYDGWFSVDPQMQEHLMFNRVVSAVFLCWAAIDFYRTYRAGLQEKAVAESKDAKKQNAD